MHSRHSYEKLFQYKRMNIAMEDFRQSKTWKSSRLLVLEVYSITKNFPEDDNPEFRNQIRRFSVLISGNIIRGLQEKNPALCRRFLSNAGLYVNRLNAILQTAYKKGYLQKSMNQHLEDELLHIRSSLEAIQHQPDF